MPLPQLPHIRWQKGLHIHVGAVRKWTSTHLVWISVFDDQHNQIRLMNLQVFVL